MVLIVRSPLKGACVGSAAAVGVWLGIITWEGVWLGAGLVGSSVAGAVSDGCMFSVAWAVGLTAVGGVVSRQPGMTRTAAKQNNKSALFL